MSELKVSGETDNKVHFLYGPKYTIYLVRHPALAGGELKVRIRYTDYSSRMSNG